MFTGLTLLQGGTCACVYIRITMVTVHAHVSPCSKVSPINTVTAHPVQIRAHHHKDACTDINEKLPYVHGKVVFLRVEQSKNEALPYVHGKVVFLRVEQSKNEKLPGYRVKWSSFMLSNQKSRSYRMYMVKWSFFVLSNQKSRRYHMYMVKWSFFVLSNQKKKIPKKKADDISSKTTFDENLATCLSSRFRLSITIGLS